MESGPEQGGPCSRKRMSRGIGEGHRFLWAEKSIWVVEDEQAGPSRRPNIKDMFARQVGGEEGLCLA